MEDWVKPENLKLLTQLVLPGFVIAYVRGRLLPNKRLELKDAIIGYVAISFLYQALLAPIEQRMILGVARLVRDEDDAADAFQNALEQIWKNLERIRRHPNPHGYILRLCTSASSS